MERWETYYHSPLSSENPGFSGAGQVVENGSFVGGGQVAHLKTIDYCSQVKTGIFQIGVVKKQIFERTT